MLNGTRLWRWPPVVTIAVRFEHFGALREDGDRKVEFTSARRATASQISPSSASHVTSDMTLADKYVLFCDCFAPIPDLLWNDSLAPTLAEIKMARRRAGFAPWCGVGFFMRRSGNQLFPDIFSNHWLSYFRPARR